MSASSQAADRVEAKPAPGISVRTMLLLGVGWFGAQVFWAFHAGSMPLFLNGFTDSKFTISLVLSLAGVTGLIIPPTVGYLSDRTSTRFGRRTPYIVAGMLGVLLCILSLTQVTAFGIVALISGFMYVSFRTAETTYLCLLPDITPPEQRSTATGVMNLVGAIGLISCFVLGALAWEHDPRLVFVIVAFAALAFMLSAAVVLREPQSPRESTSTPAGPLAYLRSLTGEANVLKFVVAQFFWWLAFWMVSTFAVLFAVQELNAPEGQSFLVPMVFAIVAAVFVLPMGMLGDRMNRKLALSCTLVCWVLFQILVGFSQNLTHALITFGLCAIPYAAIQTIGYAFFLDLIPRDRTAEFIGIGLVSMASGQICGPLIGGKLIDTLGYRSIFPCAAVFLVVGLVLIQLVQPRAEADSL